MSAAPNNDDAPAAHAAPDAPGAAADGSAAPLTAPLPLAVVTGPWRWRHILDPFFWLTVLATIVTMGGAVTGTIWVVMTLRDMEYFQGAPPGVEQWVRFALGFLMVILPMCAGMTLVWGYAALFRRRAMRGMRGGHPSFAFEYASLEAGAEPRGNWRRKTAARWARTVRERSAARAFLGPRMAMYCTAYPTTAHRLEPERIGGSMATAEVRFLVVGSVIAAYLLYSVSPYAVIGLAVPLTIVVVRLIATRTAFSQVIAGPGWVEHGPRRWTVEDSVLFVTGGARAEVRLVGPAGVLHLRLARDPGVDGQLATLWSRWMHPHPDLSRRAFEE